MRNQKGITLIVLVITIIVLIILAGVSINLFVGENGIITKAQQGKEMNEQASAKEKLEMNLSDLQISKSTDKNYNNQAYIDNCLQKQGMIVNADIVLVDQYQFLIDREKLSIVQSLGKAQESQTIKVEVTSRIAADYTKAIVSIVIQNTNSLKKIQVNGENVSIPALTEGKYSVEKEVSNNGETTVYVVDEKEEYKVAKVNIAGVSEDIRITNKEELLAFRDRVNQGATYEGRTITLTTDIDLQGSESNQWIPIGKVTFKGNFDGQNHQIHNMYIHESSEVQGLFGINDGIIKNIQVDGTMICGTNAGGIAARNNARIENCKSEVTITSIGCNVGGITGFAWINSIIDKCTNLGNIKATGYTSEQSQETFVGGIVGSHHATVTNSYNAGSVEGIRLAGGIVGGLLQGEIQNCYNTGNIKTKDRGAGGICGYMHYYSGGILGYTKIDSTYTIGNVEGVSAVGNCIGYIVPKAGDANFPLLEGNQNYCLIKEGMTAIGGTNTSDKVIVEEKSSEELKNIASALGKGFKADINNHNNGYPLLAWQ